MERGGSLGADRADGERVSETRLYTLPGNQKSAGRGSGGCRAPLKLAYVFEGGREPDDIHGGGVEVDRFQEFECQRSGGGENYHFRQRGRTARHNGDAY